MFFEVFGCSIGGIVIDQKKFEITNILSGKSIEHESDALSTVQGTNGDRYCWPIFRFF